MIFIGATSAAIPVGAKVQGTNEFNQAQVFSLL